MSAELIISCDLPCVACGYNLRTLPIEGLCPECGQPVLKTLQAVPACEDEELDDLLLAHQRKRYESIATKAGCTVDAVQVVRDVCHHAAAQTTAFGAEQRHVSAREVCDALAKHVRYYFEDLAEGKELLAEWGIRTSEDMGRIVFAMVEAKWMEARPEDSESDFAGLFTLDTLFDQAG
jgi:uncharacterized repeat protein (TIGR04138 family)